MSNISKKAVEYKVRANNLFKRGKYLEAIHDYEAALSELNVIDRKYYEMINLSNIISIRLECLNNIAMCYLVLKDNEKVIDYTTQVLLINPNNFLALSYKAKALIGLGYKHEAIDFIKKALSIKYSRSLMNNLKEIERDKEIKLSSKSSLEESIEQVKEPPTKNSIFRLIIIIKQNIVQFVKTNKFLLVLILLALIFLLRKKASNFAKNLLQILKIL